MAVGGALLSLLTAFRFQAYEAVATEGRGATEARLVLFAFAVPALLYWIIWRRCQSHRTVVGLAVGLALLVGGTSAVTFFALNTAYGSFHPASAVAAPPPSQVQWLWAGPPTSTRTAVTARIAAPDADATLLVSTAPDLTESVAVPGQRVAPDDPGVVRFDVDGLSPDTRYYYAVSLDGTVAAERTGTLRTVAAGATDLTIAVGACIQSGSNGSVFDQIRRSDPDLFIVTGDFAYKDFWLDDRAVVRAMYDQQLTTPAISALLREVPMSYVWDDHDFGPNDADKTAASGPAAQIVYRQSVPFLDLAAGPGPEAIYQSYTLGRVRVVLTDGRSERSPKAAPDDANKTMLGERQIRWLEDELRAAAAAGQVVMLVTNVPWNGGATTGADDWAGYSRERQRIADLIAATGVADQLFMVAGDAHMVAIDDGSNTDFSSDASGGFPLLQAAALDRPGSIKAGPYSEGLHDGAGQFGLVEVGDTGGDVSVRLSGQDYTGTELLSYEFTISAAALR